MGDKKIYYREGYKYQLAKDYREKTKILPKEVVKTEFIDLDLDGNLLIRRGYAWDGPSGPTIDTKNAMRGSLPHDAKYQLMREGYIDQEWRKTADDELEATLLEDGMSRVRDGLWYAGVRLFAADAALAKSEPVIWEAP